MNLAPLPPGGFRSCLLVACCMLAGSLATAAPNWRVIHSDYATDSTIVAGYSVEEFGAKGDGKTDCTTAFQEALDAMHAAGGGTVFVPEGFYVLRGSLEIPPAVTLRGEWQAPAADQALVKGTVLMAYANRGNEDAASLIRIKVSAGIRDLSIWYPEQRANQPIPYPYALEQDGFDNATFQNLTLVNPYRGIKIGPQGNELHYVKNVYGTPLKKGISYDSTTDIGRLEKVTFSSRYWAESGLPGSKAISADLKQWLITEAVGIHMLRSDWEYVDQVTVDGYHTGFMVTEGVRGAANAQFRKLVLQNCGTALSVDKTNPYGMVFADCRFVGNEAAVVLGSGFDSVVLFSHSEFSAGKHALCNRGNGVVMMEQCRISDGDIDVQHGVLSMVSSSLEQADSRIKIGSNVTGVTLVGNRFINGAEKMLEVSAAEGIVQISDEAPRLMRIPDYPFRDRQAFKPASDQLKVIAPSPKHADQTAEIQSAMDAMAGDGGIVLVPGRDYVIKGNLKVPKGVELRGVHDVPHHMMAAGSVLHIYPQNDQPTIAMESGSGLRGLCFHYPEQQIGKVRAFPFLIQGRGSDLYIINVAAANPYRFLDLMTYRCDRHYVDYLCGAPLGVGVRIGGGSRGGELRNLQFNTHYWPRSPDDDRFYANKVQGGINQGTGMLLWNYQKENMDALVLADCVDQFLYQNFVFGSLYGIRFTRVDGQGPRNLISHGHGTDGSKVSAFFEHGSEQITLVNSELVAMSSEDKTAIKVGPDFDANAVLINTMVWGQPDHLAVVEGGTLTLQNLHATQHGDGITIGNARVDATNVNFLKSGMHIQINDKGSGHLSGIITRGEFRHSSDAENLSVVHSVERR